MSWLEAIAKDLENVDNRMSIQVIHVIRVWCTANKLRYSKQLVEQEVRKHDWHVHSWGPFCVYIKRGKA